MRVNYTLKFIEQSHDNLFAGLFDPKYFEVWLSAQQIAMSCTAGEIFSPSPTTSFTQISAGVSESDLVPYNEHYHTVDPRADSLDYLQPGRFYTHMGDALETINYTHTEIYNDFLRRSHVH